MFKRNRVDEEDRTELKKKVKRLREESEKHQNTGDDDLAADCYRQASDLLLDFAEREHDSDKEKYWRRQGEKYRRVADDIDPEVEVERESSGADASEGVTDGGVKTGGTSSSGNGVSQHEKTGVDLDIGKELELDTSFDDLVGVDEEEEYLDSHFLLPLMQPEPFEQNNVEIGKGVILYGESGGGKTSIAKALGNKAKEMLGEDVFCLQVEAHNITDSRLGNSTDNLVNAFSKVKAEEPALLVLEEIDALAPRRDSTGDDNQVYRNMVNTLLSQVSQLEGHDVFCIGMTNHVDLIDKALRSSNRFDTLEVPKPDSDARRKIFELYLSKCRGGDDLYDYDKLVKLSEGFTAAEIENCVTEAGRRASLRCMRDDASNVVTMDDVVHEVKKLKRKLREGGASRGGS